jgi:threonine aldolase
MAIMNFISDNASGASPKVMAALAAANTGMASAYGTDDWTRRVGQKFCELFEREVSVHLAATGTGANALALACLVEPYQSVLTHEESHIIDDECGAPEFFTHGAKLIGLPGAGGKLLPEIVAAQLSRMSRNVKQMQPAALSISQVTENGLVYTPGEVAALAAAIQPRGLKLHMDGARFANAIIALGCTPAEITWKSGVDVLTFGGTKNGAWAAEAVIVFDPASSAAAQMPWRRKRGGHTLSKGRFIGAQFEALLEDDHWLELARHANAMAVRLAAGFSRVPGVRLAWDCQANEVFPVLPTKLHEKLKAAGAIYNVWTDVAMAPETRPGPGHVIGRFVTAFTTTESDISDLVAVAHHAA